MTLNHEPQYLKTFMLSAGAGALFGLVTALIFHRMGLFPGPAPLFIAAVTLTAGLLSGLAGMGGACLEEQLRRRGMEKALPRLAISFSAVALFTVALSYAAIRYLGAAPPGTELRRIAFGGMAAGLAFGAIFALGNYLVWRNRQRLMFLELENRHLAELAAREELLRETARNMAVSEERSRMARELHDTISQGMHGIVYSLRSLQPLLADSGRGREILDHLERTAGETQQELRRLVAELSPSSLEKYGLCEALRRHCELITGRQGLRLEMRLDYDGGLQPGQEAALYRIVQEALANAWRHAGAGQVSVELTGGPDGVTLIVRDDGCGFDPASAPRGQGLANMEARASRNGGLFSIASSPGAGTGIEVRFPGT